MCKISKNIHKHFWKAFRKECLNYFENDKKTSTNIENIILKLLSSYEYVMETYTSSEQRSNWRATRQQQKWVW